ncbi:MAG TPA: serine/threonine protein kinase [Verrucomicrobiae bacterium]
MGVRIKTQTWAWLLVVAGVVASTGWWGANRLRLTLEESLRAELETTLGANATAIEIWIANQARLATSLASEPTLRSQALSLLNAGAGGSLAERSETRPNSDDFAHYLQTRLTAIGCDGILVNSNLVVTAASGRGRGRVGKPVLDEHQSKFAELFATGQPVLIIPFRPPATARFGQGAPKFGKEGGNRGAGRGRPQWAGGGPPAWAGGGPSADLMLMQIAAPIRDDAGVVRGALALVVDPEREFTRVLSATRVGQSGESYAFDQNGVMISRSRFEEQLKQLGRLSNQPGVSSALTLRLSDPRRSGAPEDSRTAVAEPSLIPLVAAAVAGSAGVNVSPSRDYRGVPVVGAWRWLDEYGFGLVTQQDAVEAYQPLRIIRRLFLMLVGLLVLTAVGLLIVSHAHVLLRHRLTEAELQARELGQYRLEEKIGEGGMGVVYRARHALLRRATAIKLLLPDRASPEAIQQFEREVQLTSQLTHPNTIQIFDYGYTVDGLFYYVMEYLEGLNLAQLVSRFGPQPEGRVIHLLTQVCGALQEAHEKGVVHRDIKPANIVVGVRGGFPDSVKVLDFGLVREYRLPITPPNGPLDDRPVGTPFFMSPEALNHPGSVDPRSDIYSLGALGYYLVTGHHVFEDTSVAEVLRRHKEDTPQPPRLRAVNPITPEFEASLLRCLEKAPAKRPQSVAELRHLLATSPRANEWSVEQRTLWWEQFHAMPQPPAGRTEKPTAGMLTATLRLEFPAHRVRQMRPGEHPMPNRTAQIACPPQPL